MLHLWTACSNNYDKRHNCNKDAQHHLWSTTLFWTQIRTFSRDNMEQLEQLHSLKLTVFVETELFVLGFWYSKRSPRSPSHKTSQLPTVTNRFLDSTDAFRGQARRSSCRNRSTFVLSTKWLGSLARVDSGVVFLGGDQKVVKLLWWQNQACRITPVDALCSTQMKGMLWKH